MVVISAIRVLHILHWSTVCPRALCPLGLISVVLCAHLRSYITDGQDVSVLLHEPMRYGGILREPCRGILRNSCRILRRYPGLELPKQDFR